MSYVLAAPQAPKEFKQSEITWKKDLSVVTYTWELPATTYVDYYNFTMYTNSENTTEVSPHLKLLQFRLLCNNI